jgi:hypothetical protein
MSGSHLSSSRNITNSLSLIWWSTLTPKIRGRGDDKYLHILICRLHTTTPAKSDSSNRVHPQSLTNLYLFLTFCHDEVLRHLDQMSTTIQRVSSECQRIIFRKFIQNVSKLMGSLFSENFQLI